MVLEKSVPLYSLLLGVVMVVSAPAALSQTTDDSTVAAEKSVHFEEIIVTARKRNESIQDIPSSISAIGAETLVNTASFGLEDIVRLSPGVALGDTGFFGFKVFRIRGVASDTKVSTLQSPVAVYLDEVQTVDPYVPQGTADFYLTDIERVEILRGPQGTLFGSGALSGAVRIITKKPELGEFSGTVSATAESVTDGDYGHTLEGAVNIPVGESTALRLVGYKREIAGWIDNVLTGKEDINSGEVSGGRLSVFSQLSEDLDVDLLLAYQRDEFGDSFRTFDDGEGDPREWSVLTGDSREGDAFTASLVVDWDVDWATLTSVSSYIDTKYEPRGGGDYLSALIGLPGTSTWQDLVSDNDGFIQEIRVTSQSDGPLTYVIGGYYSDRDISLIGTFHNPVAEELFMLPNLLLTTLDANVKEIALFGEASLQFGNNYELSVGFRAFKNDFESFQESNGFFTGFVASVVGGDKTEEDISPRVALKWAPYDELTLYLQAAKGYRIGQVNSSLDATLGLVPDSFDSDELWNYEFGVKGIFMEGRLHANAALYYIDWDNMQTPLPGPTTSYTGNAGSARIIGLETEVVFVLTENFEIQNSMAITDAELAEDLPNISQPSGMLGASKGDPLPGTPDFTVSTALQYSGDIGNGAELIARIDHQYVGSSLNTFTDVGFNKFGNYHLFNASLAYKFSNGIGVRLYAKNLTDEDSKTNILTGNAAIGNPNAAIRLQPRTLGFSIEKSF